MKKIFLFFVIYLFIQAILGSSSKASAADYFDWYFGSHDDDTIIYEVGFRYWFGCTGSTPNSCVSNNAADPTANKPIWFTFANRSGCSGYNRCNSGEFQLNGQTGYVVQYGTSCMDPSHQIVQFTDPGGGIGNRYYSAGAVDISALPKHAAGIAWFVANGGGTIDFGSDFSDERSCPVPVINQCSSGAQRCSGLTSQTCRNVGGGTQWVNTETCTSDCDNGTGQCRHRTCQSNSCVWSAGNTSDACGGTSGLTCATTPPGGTTCTPGNRQCIGLCQYQVCNSAGTAWGPTTSCSTSPLSGCVSGGSLGASCQTSAAGQCSSPGITCQQCNGNSCQTYTDTTHSTCQTSCGAGCGLSC